ncbi:MULTISPECIES: ubiquinol-cytochrome c reductase iron-sulfur subunit [Shewanella]|jgi:ubiquinol-cytochrome c reductase iron-sulfur subunit|uniref:ubiquinol-cytochrome c reductase iron-sulfur subunit n=1 Tax=Shewanella TaxID=22 RepID=UPI00167232BF|nr:MULTISPECIES: ubiquinol-cytochrome c reductase iron-sulfur subunit [Shewanella]MBO1271556.1 ubiquinol-cytochrome c reductase iron-sulfur subunit [Shewanella sp. 4t3-1-2LB]MCL2906936.1 ubiquinol-cytochrome c reductase iron-sulfur subunit [Shewanella fodinae]GGZ05642.1 ubiquinol-cytochrome c reductase iron-sulfur subunit [Shewanella fodinae]
MSDAATDNGRRRFLAITTAAVGGAGVAAASIPFIKSWNPTLRVKAAGLPVEVNISKLEPGQMIRVEWRGKPIWVVRRTQEMLQDLGLHNDKLRDPLSLEPQQPAYATNTTRSIKPDVFIAVGICTHLGCSPVYQRDGFSGQMEGIAAGFLCPCHGSGFDMAGRVFQGQPAPLNLVIPPHRYLDDERVIIGVDEEIG